jgi:hypothetical protein
MAFGGDLVEDGTTDRYWGEFFHGGVDDFCRDQGGDPERAVELSPSQRSAAVAPPSPNQLPCLT